MTSARWEQLIALVERLPPDKAQKLREMLATLDTGKTAASGLSQMMKTLELRSSDAAGVAPKTLMRRICEHLEPFLVNTVDDDDAEGTVARPTLAIWWRAAKTQMPDLGQWEDAFLAAFVGGNADQAEQIADSATGELARQALSLTIKGGSPQVISDIRRIGAILMGGTRLRKGLENLGLTGPVTAKNRVSLAGLLTDRFATEYARASEDSEFNPVWLGHAAMNRLLRPWEVASLVNSIQLAGTKGVKLEETELAPLVQRVVGLLRRLAIESVNAIKETARSRKLEDITRTAEISAQYFDASEMISQQLKIERESAWGRIYMMLRKNVSDVIVDKLDKYEDVIVEFIEEWDEAEQLAEDNPKAARASAAADLLGGWRSRADRHGFTTLFSALERRTHALFSRSLGQSPEGKTVWISQKKRLLQGLRLI